MKNFDQDLKAILKAYKDGEIDIEKVMERLKTLPFEDLGHTLVDHHRVIRAGFPEVIFGEEKSVVQIKAIIASLDRRECNILVTRLSPEKAKEVLSEYPDGKYYPDAKVFTLIKREIEKKGKGLILIVTAGTSDLSVAQEAFVTAKIMGNDVEIIQDVGVSGIHRLFYYYD
ncbi:MAG: 1-(5-phosphoribosyl)-5-amino-4-imidazole-carboxylate carboxylase, partial [Deltaproteobacteria bacterium]